MMQAIEMKVPRFHMCTICSQFWSIGGSAELHSRPKEIFQMGLDALFFYSF